MSDQVLNILKYFLLALVWLFFLRVLRVVWVEIRSGNPARPQPAAPPARAGAVPAAPPRAAPPAAPPARPAPAPTPVPVRLRVIDPADQAGQDHFLYPDAGGAQATLIIGRAAASDIALPADSFASSRHARITLRDGQVWVQDLGSTNGTFVNGQRITAEPVQLRAGDRLQAGRTTLEAQA